MTIVNIDIDLLLTLVEAARGELDRLRVDRGDRAAEQRLAAAVQQAAGVLEAVALLEWREIHTELRRRGLRSPPDGACDHRRP